MKDLSLITSLAIPSARQLTTRSSRICGSDCFTAFSLTRRRVGPNCGIGRQISDLRAETMGTSAALSVTGQEPTGVYEAVLPETGTLVGMGFILVLCVALYLVWDTQVVPVSRTKLAISKNRGEVKEYLDELKASTPSSSTRDPSDPISSKAIAAETGSETYPVGKSSSIESTNVTLVSETDISVSSATFDDRAFERWLFTDWLQDNKSEKKSGRQKEPALPILKSARWNSGDNPVVVAAFLMLVGILFTAVTERLASFG